MTDQNIILADKVQELADKYDNAPGNPDRLLVNAIADLRALLPDPPQPPSGLLGRWAKHDAFGDVVVISDHSPYDGNVWISYPDNSEPDGVSTDDVPLADLTFPHQATKPEDVPAGEAWRVSHCGYGEFNAVKTSGPFPWRFFNPEIEEHDGFRNNSVTLVCPLAPERPETDLQARYDELEKRWKHLDDLYSARGSFIDELNAKYREAQERIKTLERANTPRTVRDPEEYDALPVGSVVKATSGYKWKKYEGSRWRTLSSLNEAGALLHDHCTRTVLRYGWGDEQHEESAPAWRIEHDPDNLRVGECVIDIDGYTGTINRVGIGNAVWCVGMASSCTVSGPWIVFPNEEAATPEATAEAKQARDKEMDK